MYKKLLLSIFVLTEISAGIAPTSLAQILPERKVMSPPPGYSHLIFDDKFSGKKLNAKKWIPQIADQNDIWTCKGTCSYPLSGSNPGSFDAEYFSPEAIIVDHGLTITAKPNKSQAGYSWQSGVITTHGKFTFNSGYVQIRAKMPDSRSGMWGGLWFLEGGGEIDLDETGYTSCGSSVVNSCIASNLHTSGNSQQFHSAGENLSAGYHIYGMEYKPGQSITMYLDGKEMAQYTSNIPTGAYTILIDLQVAQNASGWHTLVSRSTPSLKMHISEVQIWQ